MSIDSNAKPITRYQNFLAAIAGDENAKTLKPLTRKEHLLGKMADNPYAKDIEPLSYDEYYLKEVAESGLSRNYVETVTGTAGVFPRMLEGQYGTKLQNHEVSILVNIDISVLGLPLRNIAGYVAGSPDMVALRISDFQGDTLANVRAAQIVWSGDSFGLDAGMVESNAILYGGEVASIPGATLLTMPMTVTVYHHPMPKEA